MKRRLCSLILVFCLILGILPLNVLAAGTGFEYKISGTANYTITGDKGSVNGYSWISSNEVHVALTSDTPNDAQITLVEQDNVTTLVDGYGKYQWSTGDEFWGDLKNWVIAYKVDELPVLVQNQAASESIEILAKETYTVDLESVFTDADEDDIVSYQVKVNNGGYVNINGSNYSYTPDTAGTTKLTFRPYDGFVYGKKTFTVNITAIDSVATYDVSVNNLPEGAKFFSNNGFNADGTDIQGDELEAVYAAGVYTVKVPDNADCISIDVNGAKSTVRVSKETAIVNMQKITFVVETMAGDSAEGIVAVTYGEDRRAVGLGNVFYLPSGEG